MAREAERKSLIQGYFSIENEKMGYQKIPNQLYSMSLVHFSLKSFNIYLWCGWVEGSVRSNSRLTLKDNQQIHYVQWFI